jgi:hypothetical protein
MLNVGWWFREGLSIALAFLIISRLEASGAGSINAPHSTSNIQQ